MNLLSKNMELTMSDNHAIEALNERLDDLMDVVDEIGAETYAEINNILDKVKQLEINMASVISMFTQMNISLLQIQSEVLGKDGA
jgi:citrate lyase alpha subunit